MLLHYLAVSLSVVSSFDDTSISCFKLEQNMKHLEHKMILQRGYTCCCKTVVISCWLDYESSSSTHDKSSNQHLKSTFSESKFSLRILASHILWERCGLCDYLSPLPTRFSCLYFAQYWSFCEHNFKHYRTKLMWIKASKCNLLRWTVHCSSATHRWDLNCLEKFFTSSSSWIPAWCPSRYPYM